MEEKYYPILVKFFSQKEPKKSDTKKNPFSHYLPSAVKSAILQDYREKYLADHHYILCPIYEEGDIQIGCTGSATDRELPDKKRAMSRELGEELGIVPTSKEKLYRILSRSERGRYGVKKYSVYGLALKDCLPVVDSQHGIKVAVGRDVRNEKVGCIVYGTKSCVEKFLSQPKIYRYYSTDDLVGIAAVSIKHILAYIK